VGRDEDGGESLKGLVPVQIPSVVFGPVCCWDALTSVLDVFVVAAAAAAKAATT
jgi:hypothetical protein